MHTKIETITYENLGIQAEIFSFRDYRRNFYFVLHNGDIKVRSNVFPTKNICINQLNSAIKLLWR